MGAGGGTMRGEEPPNAQDDSSHKEHQQPQQSNTALSTSRNDGSQKSSSTNSNDVGGGGASSSSGNLSKKNSRANNAKQQPRRRNNNNNGGGGGSSSDLNRQRELGLLSSDDENDHADNNNNKTSTSTSVAPTSPSRGQARASPQPAAQTPPQSNKKPAPPKAQQQKQNSSSVSSGVTTDAANNNNNNSNITASNPDSHNNTSSVVVRRRNLPLFKGDTVDKWKKGALIGKGATGIAYEAIEEASQTVFCVKEVEFTEDFAENPQDRQRFEALKAEVALLQEVKHPNVVRFLGIDKIGFSMYIMMEFVSGGSIQDIVKQFGALSDDVACKYARQAVEGLAYLHGKGIVHRDIKGANLLVGIDGSVRVADFGAARRLLDPEELFNTLAGTPYWMSPEVVRQEGHGKPADVWSLGATVLEMITGLAPYQSLAPVPALFRIGHGTDIPVPADIQASELTIDFIKQCLQRDASQRPTMEELCHHPWFVTTQHQHIHLSAAATAQQQQDSSKASNATKSYTAEAAARRTEVKTSNIQPQEEEDEIMEFIMNLTAFPTTSDAGDGGGGGNGGEGAEGESDNDDALHTPLQSGENGTQPYTSVGNGDVMQRSGSSRRTDGSSTEMSTSVALLASSSSPHALGGSQHHADAPDLEVFDEDKFSEFVNNLEDTE